MQNERPVFGLRVRRHLQRIVFALPHTIFLAPSAHGEPAVRVDSANTGPTLPCPTESRQRARTGPANRLRTVQHMATNAAPPNRLNGEDNARDSSSATARAFVPQTVSYEQFTLPNGLDVLLHQDRSLPLIAVNIWYHVGPVNEPSGRSGFAHLFEHLMFEGSTHVGPNFDKWLEGVGATNSNGTTSWDRTNYFETVPREHLELVLWIESDRMGYLRDYITQERLDVQREVVKNERRQTYENAPYGPSALALLDNLFPENHPYHGAVIGSMQDLSAATLDDVRGFAEQYYAPSNATLCIAGDFDEIHVRALIEKYFGPLRAQGKPQRQQSGNYPSPRALRTVIDEPVDVAKVTLGWVAPPAFTQEQATLTVLANVLSGGKASRLYRSLVVDKQIAIDVDADVDANALGTVLSVDAMVSKSKTVEVVETQLNRELSRVIESPPARLELERAKKRLSLEFARELEILNGPGGETGRAGLLQRFNHYLHNPGAIGEWQSRIENVTAADLVDVSRRYLQPENRVTIITRPIKSSTATPRPK